MRESNQFTKLSRPVSQSLRSAIFCLQVVCLGTQGVLAAEADADQQQYELVDLGTLGGSFSEARSVNERGQVVGQSENTAGLKRAFLWENGQMKEIDADEAIDINDEGVVVGKVRRGRNFFGSPESVAFRWSESTGMNADLLPRVNVGLSPKKLTGHARAINQAGDIAMIGQGIAMYAILRHASGKSTDLGHFGGMISLAYDINDAGEVVGYSKVGRRTVHAFLYRNGALLDLGSLGRESGAHGINNKSEVVGSSKNSLARMRAFLWREGKMSDLGTLGGQSANARAINDASWIVGNSQTHDGEDHAFLTSGGKMVDLNDLVQDAKGWTVVDAFKINNRNQIAAVAKRNGFKRAVLLSPVGSGSNASLGPPEAKLASNAPVRRVALKPATTDAVAKHHTSGAELAELTLTTDVTAAGAAPQGYKAVEAFATASPDFTRVAFTAEREDKRRRRAVIDGKVHPEYLIVNDIKFSPDSKRVAYFAHPAGGEKQLLYVDGKLSKIGGTTKELQFTADSQNLVYVSSGQPVMRNNGRSQWMEAPGGVVWNGTSRSKYGMMGSIRVGNDSRNVAFTAVQQGRPVVVIGGETVGTYTDLPGFPFAQPPVLSPDGKRSAFWAKRRGRWFPVIDKQESKETFDAIDHMTFSPDSKRIAFDAQRRGASQVYIDSQSVGTPVKKVLDRVAFSPDSARYAVPVKTMQGRATIMVDGKLQSDYEVVGRPVFSPDSRYCAYWAKQHGKWFVICNGQSSMAFEDSGMTPMFSPDSSKLVYTAKQGKQYLLMVNKEQIATADKFALFSLTFSPDSRVLGYWAKQGEQWQLCANGTHVNTNFKKYVEARPQVLDFNNLFSPSMKFASNSQLLAFGISATGEFQKVTVTWDALANQNGDLAQRN